MPGALRGGKQWRGWVTGTVVLGLTPMIDSAFAYGDSRTDIAVTEPNIGLIMGGSGEPIPGADFVDAVNSLYVQPNFPGTTYPGTLADGLVTRRTYIR